MNELARREARTLLRNRSIWLSSVLVVAFYLMNRPAVSARVEASLGATVTLAILQQAADLSVFFAGIIAGYRAVSAERETGRIKFTYAMPITRGQLFLASVIGRTTAVLVGILPGIAIVARSKDVESNPIEVLEKVGLSDAAASPASAYSTGMKQRLALGMALVGDPDLLVLDEPFGGLGPHGVRLVRRLVESFTEDGGTVLLSTHRLTQVSALCDCVSIMDDGRLVVQGPPTVLKENAPVEDKLAIAATGTDEVDNTSLEATDGVLAVDANEGVRELLLADGATVANVRDRLRDAGVATEDLEHRPLTLEDVFVAHTRTD